MAYLGYFDLEFEGDELKTWSRVMLDHVGSDKYTYHKHPAVLGDTGLLFFHGQTEEEGKKRLFVRELKANGTIYELKMKNESGVKLRSKHPATSYVNDGVYFVAKEKGSKYKVMFLDENHIQTISEKMVK